MQLLEKANAKVAELKDADKQNGLKYEGEDSVECKCASTIDPDGEYAGACGRCQDNKGKPISCIECLTKCDICEETCCEDCVKECGCCDKTYCHECSEECERCHDEICNECTMSYGYHDGSVCKPCGEDIVGPYQIVLPQVPSLLSSLIVRWIVRGIVPTTAEKEGGLVEAQCKYLNAINGSTCQ